MQHVSKNTISESTPPLPPRYLNNGKKYQRKLSIFFLVLKETCNLNITVAERERKSGNRGKIVVKTFNKTSRRWNNCVACEYRAATTNQVANQLFANGKNQRPQ